MVELASIGGSNPFTTIDPSDSLLCFIMEALLVHEHYDAIAVAAVEDKVRWIMFVDNGGYTDVIGAVVRKLKNGEDIRVHLESCTVAVDSAAGDLSDLTSAMDMSGFRSWGHSGQNSREGSEHGVGDVAVGDLGSALTATAAIAPHVAPPVSLTNKAMLKEARLWLYFVAIREITERFRILDATGVMHNLVDGKE